MRTTPTQSPSSTGIAPPTERNRPAAKASFHDSLRRRSDAKKPAGPAKPRVRPEPGAHVRPDGLLVISAPLGPPPGHPDARRAPPAMTRASSGRADPRAIAITDVKVGGTKESARVHARIGEGRHAGIELRAVEQNGKVSIELVARDADAARSLRSELADLRESLRARGLESVNVEVRADVGQGGNQVDGGERPREEHVSGEEEAAVDATASVPHEVSETDAIVL